MDVITQARKRQCEEDYLYFVKYFMKKRLGSKMVIGAWHDVFIDTLNKVLSGEITRLIINISPRFG
jgi:hypothetical protein